MIPLAILNFLKFFITGNAVIDVIRNILAPIVGMIPCGMLLLTSVALSTGIIKLAKRKTLVQDLYSIEMLARVDTLCFDKTGTLTDGSMTVENIYVVDPKYEIGKILGSYISATGTNTPTAKAIYERYKDYSLKEKVVNMIPFSSARKWDAVEFEDSGTFILGAPDYVNVIGKKEIFDDDICDFIREENSIARRTLLLAHSNESADDPNFRKISPVAVISIRQNLRENVSEMIDWFYENDVDVRIISGDDLRTVTKIAHDAGIKGYENGYSLDRMSDEDVVKIVPETKIFARVSPDQKALIVKTLKENGKTVGVTGDGVNDILAMKNSDCSIAMGEGSDAARSVSNIVLLDSDFNNMPEVVREGRRVINNV
jgi:cation-transporting ATPase E